MSDPVAQVWTPPAHWHANQWSPPTDRQLYGAINSNIFGLNGSTQNSWDGDERTTNYQVHPSIRNNWKSRDRLRDVLGFGPTINDFEGITHVKENLHGSVRRTFLNAAHPELNPEGTFDIVDAKTMSADLMLGYQGDPSVATFDLIFAKDEWNSTTEEYVEPQRKAQMLSLLYQDLEDTDYAGVPYFVRYFGQCTQTIRTGLRTTDAKMNGSTEDVSPILGDLELGLLTGPYWIYNHAFEYYKYEQNDSYYLDSATYNIEINSIYNYYLDSDPDYESIIGQTAVAEALIPNYYMLEISINDRPPDPYGFDDMGPYIQQLSFGGAQAQTVRELLQGVTSNFDNPTQQTSQGYLQYYAATLQNIEEGHAFELEGQTIEDMSTIYESTYKNIAVLTPEVQSGLLGNYNTLIKDNRGTISNRDDDLLAITAYPYYNEISIPFPNQFDGPGSQVDFYQILQDVAGLTDIAAERFLTMLQLYVCYLHSTLSDSKSFNIYNKTESGPWKPMVQQNRDTDIVFQLESILQGLNNNSKDQKLFRSLAQFYDVGIFEPYWSSPDDPDLGADPDFVPLRTGFLSNYYFGAISIGHLTPFDTSDDGGWRLSTSPAASPLAPANLKSVMDAVKSLTRPVEELYRGISPNAHPNGKYGIAPSDPLMYVVEKRAISPGQLAASPDSAPVQTFFFGRDYTNAAHKGIVYNDTQIKYGVRYQYDIKQVRMVFGNKYAYSEHSQTMITTPNFGYALGNALGFFPEKNERITETIAYKAVVEENEGAMANLANPMYRLTPAGSMPFEIPETPTYPSDPFSYLSEDQELTNGFIDKGFYGYYIYRWPDDDQGNQYTNQNARDAGILTPTTAATANIATFSPLDAVLARTG